MNLVDATSLWRPRVADFKRPAQLSGQAGDRVLVGRKNRSSAELLNDDAIPTTMGIGATG